MERIKKLFNPTVLFASWKYLLNFFLCSLSFRINFSRKIDLKDGVEKKKATSLDFWVEFSSE